MHIKGFTLIELLVVISIIGVLSSVVLASLNSARSKAADTAVKAAMKQILTEAQNYLDAGNSHLGVSVGVCTSGTTMFTSTRVAQILANIAQNAGTTVANIRCTTDSTGTKWAVSLAALKGGGTWCIDNSQGWFKPGYTWTMTPAGKGTCQQFEDPMF